MSDWNEAHRETLEALHHTLHVVVNKAERAAIDAALVEIARLRDIEQKYMNVIREVETPLLPEDE